MSIYYMQFKSLGKLGWIAQGHKYHDRDSNRMCADQKHEQSLYNKGIHVNDNLVIRLYKPY